MLNGKLKLLFPGCSVLSRGLMASAVALGTASTLPAQSNEAQSNEAQSNEAQSKEKTPKERVFAVVVDGHDDAEGTAESPKYWLGILLKEIEGDLATYLGTDQGILVDSVFPDSPAEKAGLKKGDILLEADGNALTGPADLLSAMQSNEPDNDEPQTLKLVLERRNEKMQMELTPALRPEKSLHKMQIHVDTDDVEGAEGNNFTFSFSGEMPAGLLEKIGEGDIGHNLELFRLGSPSMIFIPEAEEDAFSGEMEVVIKKSVDGEEYEVKVTRSDDNPATITVTTGDDVEEFTEKDLEAMPEKIRVIVEPILKNKSGRINVNSWRPAEAKELADKYREAAKKMSENAQVSAETLRAKALEAVREARQAADLKLRGSSEVKELKELVEALRAEVSELREQLKKPE